MVVLVNCDTCWYDVADTDVPSSITLQDTGQPCWTADSGH